MIGFVDDTYGTINRSEDFHQNLSFAEEDAQLWCSLLAAGHRRRFGSTIM
jgi:hypothetical protein